MVWDNTKPTNLEKIRNLGIVIRPNWVAIEQASNGDSDADKLRIWAVNLYDRNNAVVTGADTPTRMDDAGQVYCRNDGAENELFFIDSQDPAKETQLTQDGRLGSTTTNLSTQNISFDGTYENTQYAFSSAWAVVASDGSLTTGYGITSAKNVKGDYTLTFSTALSSANYVVVGTVFKVNTRARVLWVYDRLAGSFSVRTQAINASAGSFEDNAFMVTVFGGR